MDQQNETPSAGGRALKIAGALAAVAVLWFAGRHLGQYVPRFAEWVDGLGVWGPVVFIAGYAVATVAFIPGSILTLAAGAIFGLFEGVAYVFTGATIGAAGAFLVARYVARKPIEKKIEGNERFARIDRAVAGEGLKIILLLRLAPVFPFNLLNYGLGLTKVRFRDYVIASLGMIPGTFLYVYYGRAIGSLAAVAGGAEIEKGVGYWVVFGLGLAATLGVTIFVARLAKKALDAQVGEEVGE